MTKRDRIQLVKNLALPATLIAHVERKQPDPCQPLPVLYPLRTEQDKDQFIASANKRLFWQVATPAALQDRRELQAEIEQSEEILFRHGRTHRLRSA